MKTFQKKITAIILSSLSAVSGMSLNASAEENSSKTKQILLRAAGVAATAVIALTVIKLFHKEIENDNLILEKLTNDEKCALENLVTGPYFLQDIHDAKENLTAIFNNIKKYNEQLQPQDYVSDQNKFRSSIFNKCYANSRFINAGEILTELEGKNLQEQKAVLLRATIKLATRIYAFVKLGSKRSNKVNKYHYETALKTIVEAYNIMQRNVIQLTNEENTHKAAVEKFIAENYPKRSENEQPKIKPCIAPLKTEPKPAEIATEPPNQKHKKPKKDQKNQQKKTVENSPELQPQTEEIPPENKEQEDQEQENKEQENQKQQEDQEQEDQEQEDQEQEDQEQEDQEDDILARQQAAIKGNFKTLCKDLETLKNRSNCPYLTESDTKKTILDDELRNNNNISNFTMILDAIGIPGWFGTPDATNRFWNALFCRGFIWHDNIIARYDYYSQIYINNKFIEELKKKSYDPNNPNEALVSKIIADINNIVETATAIAGNGDRSGIIKAIQASLKTDARS